MSQPRLPPSPPLKVNTPPTQHDSPPLVDKSPRLPGQAPSAANEQKFMDKDKKLFDSADYFSSSPSKRSTASGNVSTFDTVSYEASRLGQEHRSSALSFDMLQDGSSVEDGDASGDEHRIPVTKHSMRRGSMEEFFVEENEHETVKHAILEKPKLKRWDSGDFYSSPSDYRKMLATQAKEVLRQALDHPESDQRQRMVRRSSLSVSETNEDEDYV
jgi:hypothetical protein